MLAPSDGHNGRHHDFRPNGDANRAAMIDDLAELRIAGQREELERQAREHAERMADIDRRYRSLARSGRIVVALCAAIGVLVVVQFAFAFLGYGSLSDAFGLVGQIVAIGMMVSTVRRYRQPAVWRGAWETRLIMATLVAAGVGNLSIAIGTMLELVGHLPPSSPFANSHPATVTTDFHSKERAAPRASGDCVFGAARPVWERQRNNGHKRGK